MGLKSIEHVLFFKFLNKTVVHSKLLISFVPHFRMKNEANISPAINMTLPVSEVAVYTPKFFRR